MRLPPRGNSQHTLKDEHESMTTIKITRHILTMWKKKIYKLFFFIIIEVIYGHWGKIKIMWVIGPYKNTSLSHNVLARQPNFHTCMTPFVKELNLLAPSFVASELVFIFYKFSYTNFCLQGHYDIVLFLSQFCIQSHAPINYILNSRGPNWR